MTIKRLTKEDIRNAQGTFNPVGHIVVALADNAGADAAVLALKEAGFGAADVLQYSSSEVTPRLREMVAGASGAAGFGYEITLMRRYLALAEQGVGWLIVYAPEDDAAERVGEIAKRLGAECAVRYHRLANEDLI